MSQHKSKFEAQDNVIQNYPLKYIQKKLDNYDLLNRSKLNL